MYSPIKTFFSPFPPAADIVAPAVDVIGAGAWNRFVSMTGTSSATAITSGAVALLMEWALVRGNFISVTSGNIKSILILGAGRDPNRIYPNRSWGYGKLDLIGSFNLIRSI